MGKDHSGTRKGCHRATNAPGQPEGSNLAFMTPMMMKSNELSRRIDLIKSSNAVN